MNTIIDIATQIGDGLVALLDALTVAGVVSGLIVLVVLALLVAILMTLHRTEHVSLTPTKAKEVILAAEERAHAIVSEAAAEARRTRLGIEKERTHALNEDHQEVERFLDAYRFHLDKTIKELSYGVEKEHLRATSHFVEVLQSIEHRVSQDADEAKQSMDAFTSQSGTLFDRLAYQIENVEKGIQHLALALEEAASDEADKNALIVRDEMQKIGVETARSIVEVAKGLDQALKVNVEREFDTIKTELARYRDARMHIIDEKIMILVEETAQIALNKQLTIQEHADLVYRSLEEAKERGTFM
jgi:hypothetical protein